MPYLEVPGASLYHETVGSGPVLVCITGASGNVEFWKLLAEHLKHHFTVVMYDRRGFSRSYLSGAQDYAHRIQTDAADAAALLTHFSPNKPAAVLGNSSGGLVALELLIGHASLVHTVLVHEAPAHCFLPEPESSTIAAGPKQIYQVYRAQGIPPALDVFAQAVKMGKEESAGLQRAMDPRAGGPYAFANALYWFERELLPYAAIDFDLGALEAGKKKLVLVNGEGTSKEAGHYRPNVVLAEKLGLELEIFPGAHLGAVSHAEGFAKGVVGVLEGRG